MPIRIPIYRGLIGWRIPLVSAANKDLLASVRTLDDLRRLRFGQRQDWADTPILRANGLEPQELIATISSRLVVNKASMKMQHGRIQSLIDTLRDAVEARHRH